MMSKFKEALERGKEAREQDGKVRDEKAEGGVVDFGAQARAWLNDVVVASLQAAKAEVTGEVTVDIDTAPRRQTKASTPSIRFQVYRRGMDKEVARRTFTVNVQLSGEVSVSSPGMVAREVGNIGDRSDERFSTLLAELIEDAAKGT
ncbi:MAG: hypothetical protein E5X53_02660 [Mesorhizobium sp.]|jgi:hypothetical protein|uniref:hypothetical protein n=1 Tax=Mesorhizobium sp. TaxID=1871066 RepID=UPI000FE8CFE5|nr:hypothetical protein [Mesorhizobium sp.]RWM20343.1 MAG: hypothetical protein EOR73_15040 [Mesorhizobium sp.]TIP74553.1 MAG: hypothetical protein E5X55_08270 [Mesorhizobium sp.]TIQ15071.1 MAG: hypothetical protein E5X57_00375 [Mesorhizobium sp.]TIR53911.1 MAG: hypothetical protein E5X53_02660 [Mesorhizobium sp.]TJW00171.1 MAG: hypothetical protein E5X52_00375 [Mesorhizobium sp.]